MLTLYKIFTFLVYYITWPLTIWTRLSSSRKWHNRLGFFDNFILDDEPAGKLIWLHASSMGEVRVLSILADNIKRVDSTAELYVTVMTDSGYESACKLFGDSSRVGFLPLDYRVPIILFLDTIRPDTAVFIETEIWPNMIMELHKRSIPIFLANGRLSERAAGRYTYFKSGLKKVLGCYNNLMVQTEGDRDRFIGIGAMPEIIEVTGSLKFDAPMAVLDTDRLITLNSKLPFAGDSRVFIAGSTRNGENEIILDLYIKLREKHDNIRLIIVPRHLERVDAIVEMTESRKLTCIRYTRLSEKVDDSDTLIVDKMGILNDLYAISDIAFVGGTLVDIGGHNILEPVWAGTPVLYGPNIKNVTDSSDYILKHNYGAIADDGDALLKHLDDFLAGTMQFKRKTDADNIESASERTAHKILSGVNEVWKDSGKK